MIYLHLRRNHGWTLLVLIYNLATIICLDIYDIQNDYQQREILVTALILFNTLIFLTAKKSIHLLKADMLFAIFALYLLAKALLNWPISAMQIGKTAALIISFFMLRVLVETDIKKLTQMLFLGNIFSLLIITFVFVFRSFWLNKSIDSIFFPNKSLLAVLISSQLLFVISYYFYNPHIQIIWRFSTFFLVSLCVVTLFILAICEGRSGWIGLLFGIFFLTYVHFREKVKLRLHVLLIIAILFLLIPILYFSKQDSSNGRILIYKISFQIFKENWLNGIGYGEFAYHYNNYQANYFLKNNIDSKEALLADNTFYAFNEPLQFLVEHGLLGIIIILYIIIELFRKSTFISDLRKRQILLPALSSLLSIIAGSLFSYPLQVFPIAIHFLFLLALASACLWGKEDERVSICRKIKYLTVILTIIALFHLVHLSIYRIKSAEAFTLALRGSKIKAEAVYKKLLKSYIKDQNVDYLYSRQLYYSNNAEDAYPILIKLCEKYPRLEVLKTTANVCHDLKLYQEEEKLLLKAVYMVPNRVLSRYALFEFYKSHSRKPEMKYWGESILNMHIKINSPVVTSTLEKVRINMTNHL